MNDERKSVPFGDDTLLADAVPRKSNYLTKDDCDPPILVQIAYLAQDQIQVDNNQVEDRGVLYFHGDVKPLILNATNRDILMAILGAQSAGQLKNQQVVLYNDLSVVFQGKVGGIRIRSAQQQAAPVSHVPNVPGQLTAPAPDDFDDDIPY